VRDTRKKASDTVTDGEKMKYKMEILYKLIVIKKQMYLTKCYSELREEREEMTSLTGTGCVADITSCMPAPPVGIRTGSPP